MPMAGAAGAGAVRKKPTSAHQIVSGSGDILTRRGRPHHRGHQQNGGGGGGKDGPNRKFSSLVNEYVGNCLEDNCNIGEGRRERADSRRVLLSEDRSHKMLLQGSGGGKIKLHFAPLF